MVLSDHRNSWNWTTLLKSIQTMSDNWQPGRLSTGHSPYAWSDEVNRDMESQSSNPLR